MTITITIHPLRFARRPCLRGTVSYCLLMQNKMAPRNVMPSLFYILSEGVASVSSVLSPFFFIYHSRDVHKSEK